MCSDKRKNIDQIKSWNIENLRTKRTKFLWRNAPNHSELKQKNVEQKNINQTYFKCENNVSNARNIKKIVLSSNTFILNALSEKGIIFA